VCPAPYHFFYFTEPDYGAELSRDVNHGIAKLAADMPDRFVGLGTVPLQDSQLAIRELEYCVKSLGMRGVEICTNVNGKNLTDPSLKLDKFFARCEELGVLIFMHPLGYTQADRLTNHYFNNVIGNPLESTIAIGHLIFGGVLDSHPGLKICVAHGGVEEREKLGNLRTLAHRELCGSVSVAWLTADSGDDPLPDISGEVDKQVADAVRFLVGASPHVVVRQVL